MINKYKNIIKTDLKSNFIPDIALPIVTVVFTNNIKDAIPDLCIDDCVEQWRESMMSDINDGKENSFTLFVSNSLVFTKLRILFQNNLLGDLNFVINESFYDLVMPDGKLIGHLIKDDDAKIINIHKEQMLELL